MPTPSYFSRTRQVQFAALLLASCCTGFGARAAETLNLTPFHKSGVYARGETVGWKIDRAPATTAAALQDYVYVLRKNNLEVLEEGPLDLTAGNATVEATVYEPAMLYLEIKPVSGAGKPIVAGAAVAPTELQPVVPRPADFDSFWASHIAALKSVPENAVLNPGDSGRSDVQYATFRMDNVGGSHVYGQIAWPKRAGKFPALLIMQWASPPYPLQKVWVVDRAAQGWLVLNVSPHDVLPTEPPSYYAALPDRIKHYESIGNDDREKSYFLRMYLGDYRAADYLVSRPDWDGKTLVCYGISMGGQQSLCLAGLHPWVTHVVVNVPAGCDTNGPLHGRQASYPNFPANNPKVMEAARYFDAINFAKNIKATCLVAMGFVDTVSAPAGIWTAFNQIAGPKEVAPMVDSPHNHLATPAQQRPWTDRSEEWLRTLVKGEQVTVKPLPGKSTFVTATPISTTSGNSESQGIPREDENSKIAHGELLNKARAGGIDLYFLGDSITRRWGCNDQTWRALYDNWKENYWGWNAGNFGWGGDTTQNILWRITNGELDGVNPKVIVLLAGTNDVGAQAGDDAKVDAVVGGIESILAVCRKKAPDAKIILTAIFPRNDNIAAVPTIDRINQRIEKFADGDRIRFLNVNDKLADRDGNLFPGMMNDGLHLNVQGYQVWANGLKPILTELLGPPAATDHAPPPTGDPSVK
jgi:cephalosporin-C deacetylase-like acetyl esterase/lysophospholipase L1-like esterase